MADPAHRLHVSLLIFARTQEMNFLAFAASPFRRARTRRPRTVVARRPAMGTLALEQALARNDSEAVLREVCRLGIGARESIDDIAQELITLLATPQLWSSDLAGYVLNFFVFWAPHLSARSKRGCASLLALHGDKFAGAHSSFVVGELRSTPCFSAIGISA